MTTLEISREEVIKSSNTLPGFPLVIAQILATIDDPEANTETLAGLIKHDPVIAARVLALANAAAAGTRHQAASSDIFTAVSLIGMNRVREMALLVGVSGFVGDMAPAAMAASFWQHSVAVGVCSDELARHTSASSSASAALIAGLLHDIGQLWLHRFRAEPFSAAWTHALAHDTGIEQAEREHFGADHSMIGAWLAEHWALPANIVAAIRYHHEPDSALAEPLVPLLHVAEVLSNALDLTGREGNRVTSISSAACSALGLSWDASARDLFGRMEARSRHANALFGASS